MEGSSTLLLRTLEYGTALGTAVVALEFQAVLANVGDVVHGLILDVCLGCVIRADAISFHASIRRQ